MNGPFQVAQANIATQTSGKPPARIVKVTKPFGDQSVVVPLSYDGSVKADLSSIAGENITLVHLGEKLIILFDNKSTVTLEPFFDSNGKPLDALTVEVSPGRDLTGTEFAALFPVTEDRSILPAAGDGNGPGAQASGANFTSVGVDPLAAPNPIDLLGQEDLPNFTINTLLQQNTFINGIPSAGLTGLVSLDEDEIPGVLGNAGGPGDIVAPHTFSGVLTHDFALDGAGGITFAAMNGVQQLINGITVTFTWNDATHTLTANDGSGDVFQVVITNPQNGDYTVTLLSALHHHTDALADNTEASDIFNLTYTVTDSNGTTATGTLALEINDDTPVAHDSAPIDTTVGNGESPSGEGGNGEGVTHFATIDDEGQSNGISGGNGDDAGDSTSVSGKLDIAPGADGLKAVAFTGLDGQPHVTVTADNDTHPALQVIFVDPQTGVAGAPEDVTLVWQADGNGGGTLIGISAHFGADHPAFTLTVDAQGNYTFDVSAPFAHPLTTGGSEGSTGWEDNLHVQFTYTATDGDGDKSSATLTFNVDDDTPTVVVTTNEGEGNEGQLPLLVSLDESIGGDRGSSQSPTDGASDDTGHTQPDPHGVNPIGEMKTAAGDGEIPGGLQSLFNVVKDAGADGEKSVTYSYTLSLTGSGEGEGQNAGVATTLKATGYENSTIYLFQEDATHIIGRVGGENGDIAIRITLTDANDLSGGQLVVEQYLAIDHGNDGNNFDSTQLLQLLGEGTSLGVTLTTTITDGDGDQATNSATAVLANGGSSSIGFQDDGPAPLAISAANGAANGLFFDGFTPNNDQWGAGSGINTSGIAGAWHIAASSHDGAQNIQLERVGDGYRGADSPTDSVMVDMEATPGNLMLTQDIGNLSEGTVYHLTFEIGAASDAAAGSAQLEVFWNGVSVGTYTPHSGVMQTISIDVTAGSGNNQLTFEEIGTSGDNTGTFLANVKLADVVIIDETKGNDPGSDDVDASVVGALFASVTHVGVDPNMDQPQYAKGTHPVIVLGTPDYGTDGPAATNPIQVGLALSAQGVDSGLTTTDGHHIFLFVENGLVVGRYDADNDAGHTPETAAFALSIDQSGNLSIAQYVSLHHPDTGSNDEGVYLNSGTVSATVTLTDGDGDHTTSSADISSAIRFEDDGPSIDAAQSSSLRDWTIDEDVLANGNDAYDVHPDTNDYTALNGKPLGVNWGADGAKALTFTATDSHTPTITVTDQNGAPVTGELTSGGVALTYDITTNPDGGQTLTAYKGADHSPGNVIFTLTLDPDAGTTGTFSFELKGPLDHPTGEGENTLNLNFGFAATDGDDDTASSSLTIRVTDDVPVVAFNAANYITNGNFQDGNWSAPAWWGSSAGQNDVPGWSISGDPSLPPQNGIQFERPVDGFLNLHSSTGQGMIDMGGSPGNYDLTQQIGANGTPHLVNGQQYVLELEVGAPFPATAKMEVWWNNTLIGVIDTNVSSGQMEKFAFIVTGSGNPATDQLTFKEVGEGTAPIDGTFGGQPLQNEGYHGTYIANVKMFALNGVVDEDALNNANAHGIGDSQPGDAQPDTVVVSGDLGVKWGSDQSDVADVNGIQDGANSTLTGRSLTFTNANVAVLGVNVLTSNGEAVHFASIDNNTKLVGYVDSDHSGSYSNGDRLVFDVTLSDDGTGSFKFTLHDNLDHAPGASENDIALQFNFTATDSDGDSANGTFAVGVDDDMPALVGGHEVSVSVNENDILTPWSIGSSPLDGHTELSTGAAKVTGSLAGLVNFGADGPGHNGFGFADKATVIAYMESLHLFSKQTALPENGKELTYDLVGNVLTATEPGPQGNVVFTLTLNANGTFEFRLFDELVHVAGDGTNTDLRSGETGSISGIDFGHIVVATDSDGDTVVLGDNFRIEIIDDVPQVSITSTLLGVVQHDETPGVQFLQDTNDPSVKAIFTGVVNPGDDLDVAGSGAIGYAHSLLPAVNVHVNYGADYPAAAQNLSLQLIDATTHKPTTDGSLQVDSGLTTTEHQRIFLVKEGDLIVGRVDVNGDGRVDQTEAAAFAIQIGQDGSLNVAQYLSLHHPDTSSNDESVNLNNLIAAQVSVTDSDGDTATDFVEIGDKIRFDDDGPTAVNDSQKSVVEGAAQISGNVMSNDTEGADGATVTSVHVNGQDYAVPQQGGTSLIVSSTLGIYTFDKDGNWTFKPNSNLNNANGSDASFTYQLTDGDGDTDTAKQTIKVTDGAGPSVGSAITISLDEEALGNANATGTNPSSTAEQDHSHSLTFTSGSDNITSIAFAAGTNGITTNVDGINGADIVWTRVDDTHLIGKIGGVNAISVELTLPGLPGAGGNTGNVVVTATLLDNFPHPNGNGENTITISGIKVVATDTDGDTATGNITVTVKDDVPVVTQLADAISVDEGNLPSDRNPTNPPHTTVGIAQSGFGSLHINWGADNGDAKHLAFAKDGNGHVIGPDLKSDGVTLLYEIHTPSDSPGNEQIVAYKAGDPTHTPVFSITLYEDGSGGYAYVQYQNIDQSGQGADTSAITFNIVAYDADGDSVGQALTINVKDDIPTAGSTSLAVDEDDLSTGNADVQDGDNLANPSPTVISDHLAITGGADGVKSLTFLAMSGHTVETTGGAAITMNHLALTYVWVNGTLYATTDAGHPSDANSAFKVTITDASTGAYTFTLLHNVDHPLTDDSAAAPVKTAFEDNLDISLTFTVTDGDNDSTTGSLTINIDDDVPVILSPDSGSTTEANIATSAVAHGSLGIHFGADGPAAPAAPASSGTPHTINFNDAQNGALPGGNYTHDGFTFHTDQGIANVVDHGVQKGIQMYGSAINVVNNGNEPFTISQMDLGLFGTSTGVQADNVRLTGIDTHGNTIVVIFNVGTTIGLGDAATTFHAAGTAFDGVSLSSLTIEPVSGWQGNYIFNGSVVVDNVVFNSGSAPLTHGAVSFTDLTTASHNVAIADDQGHQVTALTSQGKEVHYALLDSMTLVGYTGDTAPTAINGANVVFSVVLSLDANHPNGNYDFTLHQPLDDLPSGTVSDLNLTFNFTAKDGDGDAVSSHFTVDVKDDVPHASAETGTVAEGGSITGVLDFVAGADGATVTHINGVELHFGQDGYAGPIDIGAGTIKVKADGSYIFTADASVHNTDGAPVVVDTTFTVTDSDGDTSTANIHFDVTDANHPTAGTSTAAVDDDGLPGGNPDSNVGDLDANVGDALSDTSEATFTGKLVGTMGGDGPGTFSFINGSGNVGAEHVTYTWSGNTLTGTVSGGDRDGTTLFTVEITDSVTGAYKLTLNENVLHTPGDNAENGDAGVELVYTVTDSDGSEAIGTLKVTFDDDAPTAHADINAAQSGQTVSGNVITDVAGHDAAGADGIASIVWAGANGGTVTGDHGTLTIGADGSYSYHAFANTPSGNDIFHYTITDGDGDTSTTTLTIAVSNGQPLPVAATGQVDEAALGTGSNPGSNAETVNGTLTLGDPNTPHVTNIEGTGSSSVVGGSAVTVHGAYGDLKIDADGNYTYTLTSNDPHHSSQGTGSDGQTDVFTYTVTDAYNNTSTSTITIAIKDDVPTAVAGNAVTIDETASVMTGDNLLSGDSHGVGKDTVGADGASVTHVKLPGSGQFEDINTWASDGHGGHTKDVAGVGVYTFNADGSWTFDPHSNASNANIDGSFSYRITDGDGDISDATQALTVKNAVDPLAASAFGGTVEEEQLQPTGGTYPITASGNEDTLDADGHDTDASGFGTVTNIASGHFGVTGGDGTYTYSFSVTEKAAVGLVGGGTLTSDGETVRFHQVDADTVIGYVDGGANNGYSSGERVVFSLDIGTDGSYTFKLYDNVDHPIETSGGAATEDSIKIDLNNVVVANDGTQPALPLQGSITVIDDTPVAHDQTAHVTEGSSPTLNAILVIDLSASMDDNSGVQGLTRLELMQQAVANYLHSSNVHFNEIVIYTFNDGAHYEGTFTNVQDAIDKVNSYGSNDLVAATEYDSTAHDVSQHFEDNVHLTPADQTHLLFLSDGDPTGGSGLSNSEQNDWRDFLNEAGVDKVFAVGFGGIDDTSFLNPMAPRPGDEAIAVENPDQLATTLEGSLPSEISGNILAGHDGVAGTADDVSFGADGGHIHSIKVGDVTYTYDPNTGNIAASDGHNPTQHTPELTVTTALGGTLDFNFATGAWDYSAPPNGVSQTTDEHFNYVIVDGDGDTAGATLTVTVVDVPNAPPVLHLNEAGAGGNISDSFSSSAYNGGSGWNGSWVESGDSSGSNGGVSSGSIRISSGELRLGDNSNSENGDAYIERSVNLSGASSAVLTFTYEKDTSSTSNEGLTVQAWNGTEWRDLTTAAVSGTDADGSTGTRTAELTSQDTKIRFVMNDELDNNEYYYIDNVNIGYTTVTPSVDHVASFIENGAAISIASAGPTITDTDDTVMESAKIVLTNAKAGDILAVGGLPSGIGYTLDTSVVGQITVNLSGNASLASYQAAIKAVTYQSTSDNPGSDDRVIHVTVTDDHGNASNVATTTVHVTPTNDPFTAVDDHILTNVTDFSAIHIPNAALLYNDTNPDGDTLAVQSVSGPSGGTVVSGVTFDPTDPPSTVEVVKTYNFATAGAGTAKSFEVDIDGDSPLASLSMTGTSSSGYDNAHTLSASEYSQIATADDTRYRTADPGNGDNAVFWAQFTITENVADITKIDLKIEAIQDNSGGSSDGMEFGVWNYHTNSWQSIQEIRDTSSPDANFTFSITTHPEYYVGTDGKVTLVLFNEDDSGSGSNNQRISVDYVEVKVTSDVPAPPSHFTDGSFDYTATDGTTPDTGHVDVTGVVGSTIEGTASGEILLAGNGDDTLHGNGGNDYLIGGIGADILDGGNDNDILVGGAGIDKLTGGAGADHFRFEALSEGGDHIVDFQHGTDSIDLLLSSFSALAGPAGATVAPNDFSVQASADAAAHADIGTAHLAYYQGTGANDPGKLYYDADGGGDANRVLIAILDNHAQVTASDIHKV